MKPVRDLRESKESRSALIEIAFQRSRRALYSGFARRVSYDLQHAFDLDLTFRGRILRSKVEISAQDRQKGRCRRAADLDIGIVERVKQHRPALEIPVGAERLKGNRSHLGGLRLGGHASAERQHIASVSPGQLEDRFFAIARRRCPLMAVSASGFRTRPARCSRRPRGATGATRSGAFGFRCGQRKDHDYSDSKSDDVKESRCDGKSLVIGP